MTATVTVLFCGAGGDSLGAETAGMRDVMAAGSWQRGDLVLIQWLAGARDAPGELARLALSSSQQGGYVGALKCLDVGDHIVHDVQDHGSFGAVDNHVSVAGSPRAVWPGCDVEAAAGTVSATAPRRDTQLRNLFREVNVALVDQRCDQLSGELGQDIGDLGRHPCRLRLAGVDGGGHPTPIES